MEKVLVLGATGAMGVYVVPELTRHGFDVTAVSLDDVNTESEHLRYIKADAKDVTCLKELLAPHYDAVIDFMLYNTAEYRERYDILANSTGHYIFLSSYRVYGGKDSVITESSPRLLDVITDDEFLASDDYALTKARQENILTASKYTNWTIVRPSIVYSKRRFQLVTLEANVIIPRARAGKAVVLPKEAENVQSTMTWSGDIAKMLASLLFKENAKRESFTLATAEHNAWGRVAQIYKDVIGLDSVYTDKESFLRIVSEGDSVELWRKWQLNYDRLFDRAVDNSKLLSVTGLKQSDFSPLEKALSVNWRRFRRTLILEIRRLHLTEWMP